MTIARSQKLPLAFPIPLEDGKAITELTMRRPTTRDIADFVVLIGGERIASVLKELLSKSEGDEISVEDLKQSELVNELIDNLSSMIKPEFLDDSFALLSRMLGIDPHQAEELAPEDTAKVYGALSDFFPQLFSSADANGEDT
jgi:hypothetical protein